jgi:hypothetical protein
MNSITRLGFSRLKQARSENNSLSPSHQVEGVRDFSEEERREKWEVFRGQSELCDVMTQNKVVMEQQYTVNFPLPSLLF